MTANASKYREVVVPAVARDTRRAAVMWLVAFAASLTLYVLTMTPDLAWLDAGDYQWSAARLDLERPGEAVRVHPLFIVMAHGLGRVGLCDYARATTVTSALGTAVTVANVWLIVWLLVRRRLPATVAALACMLAHTIWQLGVQPQTYGWANAATSTMLVSAVAYGRSGRLAWLMLVFFVGGVGLSIHLMSQLALGVLGVWVLVEVVRRRAPVWVLPAGVGLWLVGGVLFWYVALTEYERTGDVALTLRSAFFGDWGSAVLNLQGVPRMLWRSLLMLVLNFPTPLGLLGAYGLWRSRRLLAGTPMAPALAGILFVYVLFAARYRIENQNYFFTPVYMLVAVYIGLGVSVAEWARRRAAAILLVVLALAVVPAYWAIAETARAVKFNLRPSGSMHDVPYRDAYAFYLLPWQQAQTGPRRFAEEAMAALPPQAVLLPDTTTSPPLKYVHDVEGRRPDVLVVDYYDAKFDASLARFWHGTQDLLPGLAAEGRRLFVTSDRPGYVPKWVLAHARLEAAGHLFEAKPRAARDAPPVEPEPAGGEAPQEGASETGPAAGETPK